MSNMFLISDTHFGHKLMVGLRGFKSEEDMDEFMVERWNSAVKPQDHVYHLGDVAINKRCLPIVSRLNGKKRLIFGNHDIYEYQRYAAAGFQKMMGYRVLDGMILSHIPIHPNNHGRFNLNVHGHMHTNNVMIHGETASRPDPRYFCVCVEQINYTPISLEEIKQKIQQSA